MTVQWLNDNGMDSTWRKKRFGKSGNHHRWFQVPVAARRKQTTKRKSVQTKPLKTQKKKKTQRMRPGMYVEGFSLLGSSKKHQKIYNCCEKEPQVSQCC